MSSGNTERQLQFMTDLGATILCCTPSYAAYLAESAIEAGLPDKLKLKAGIFGAEAWTEEMRHDIEAKLGLKAYDIYGLTEISGPGVAFECEEQHGMHINEDHFIAEIIDPITEEVLPYGTKGELVFTALTKEAFPMIRYRTRDICVLNAEPCSCGRTHIRMSKPMGRSDDMLIIRGVNVFPSQIEQVIASFPEVSPFYTITISSKGPLDVAELAVECAPDFAFDEVRNLESLKRRLKEALRSNLQIAVDIKLVEPKTIARSEGKAKHVIDLRQTTTAGRGATLTNVAPARH
jgi:phenylacetate-CoA ligase